MREQGEAAARRRSLRGQRARLQKVRRAACALKSAAEPAWERARAVRHFRPGAVVSFTGGVDQVFDAMKKKSATARRRRSAAASRKETTPRKASRRWSADVTQRSNALDLEQGVFTRTNPKEIAASLKRSAEASDRRKADAFRSALSMLTFYINRAGTNLSALRRRILTRAKDELRRQFGR
jgi:hypothetical protein